MFARPSPLARATKVCGPSGVKLVAATHASFPSRYSDVVVVGAHQGSRVGVLAPTWAVVDATGTLAGFDPATQLTYVMCTHPTTMCIVDPYTMQ